VELEHVALGCVTVYVVHVAVAADVDFGPRWLNYLYLRKMSLSMYQTNVLAKTSKDRSEEKAIPEADPPSHSITGKSPLNMIHPTHERHISCRTRLNLYIPIKTHCASLSSEGA
jgi:hypothetical protein